MKAATRALATLPAAEASHRLRATRCHEGWEARGPKQTAQHNEEMPAASILHTPIAIGARGHPKWRADQPHVASSAARLRRNHEAKVLPSMKTLPAHTNQMDFVAAAANLADAACRVPRPANSTPAWGGRASGRLGLERLETGRMDQVWDTHIGYGSVRVRTTSAQHPPDAIFSAFLPSLS